MRWIQSFFVHRPGPTTRMKTEDPEVADEWRALMLADALRAVEDFLVEEGAEALGPIETSVFDDCFGIETILAGVEVIRLRNPNPFPWIEIPDDLADRLDVAARDRVVGRNRLVELLLEDGLELLIPVEDLKIRRPAT